MFKKNILWEVSPQKTLHSTQKERLAQFMQNIFATMKNHLTYIFSAVFLGLLSFQGTAIHAIDNVTGVKPSALAGMLHGQKGGSGYHGTFFVKSPELIEIGNNMLKRSGVQYTITNENTRSHLNTYVTTGEALGGEDVAPVASTIRLDTSSFSQVNEQVQAQNENATAVATQRDGALFSDVSDLLQQ